MSGLKAADGHRDDTAVRERAGPRVGARLGGRGRTITEADLVGFASLTGDWHPQHADAEWAAGSRFGERVAHGMLVLSYSLGLCGFDPETVVALRGLDSVVFKRPVGIGETIRVEATVNAAQRIGEEEHLVELGWRVLNQDDRLVLRARLRVVWRVPGGDGARAPGHQDGPPERDGPASSGSSGSVHELYGDRLLL